MMYISPIDNGRGDSSEYNRRLRTLKAGISTCRDDFELSDRLNQKVVFFYGRVDEKDSLLYGFIHDFVGAIGISTRICCNYHQD